MLITACSGSEIARSPYDEITRSDLKFPNYYDQLSQYVKVTPDMYLEEAAGVVTNIPYIPELWTEDSRVESETFNIFKDIQNEYLIQEVDSDNYSLEQRINVWKKVAGEKPSDFFDNCEKQLNDFIENKGIMINPNGTVYEGSFNEPHLPISESNLAQINPAVSGSYDVCNDWLGFFELGGIKFTFSGVFPPRDVLNEDEFIELDSSCYDTISNDILNFFKEELNSYNKEFRVEFSDNLFLLQVLRSMVEPRKPDVDKTSIDSYENWDYRAIVPINTSFEVSAFSVQDNFISLFGHFWDRNSQQNRSFNVHEGFNYNLENCKKYNYTDVLYELPNIPQRFGGSWEFFGPENSPYVTFLMNKWGIFFYETYHFYPNYYLAPWDKFQNRINFIDNKSLFVNFADDY